MGTPTFAFVNTTVMDDAAVTTADDAVRDYLNGQWVLGDFAAAGIRSEQLYRPDWYATPAGDRQSSPRAWFDGEFGALHDVRRCQNAGGLAVSMTQAELNYQARGRGFGHIRDRYPIYPNFVALLDGRVPLPGLVDRISVEVPGSIRVCAQWYAGLVAGTAGDKHFGRFQMCYRRVEDGNDGPMTNIAGTIREILHTEERHNFMLIGHVAVASGAEGTYDVAVVYEHAGLADANATQLSVCQGNMTFEVVKEG